MSATTIPHREVIASRRASIRRVLGETIRPPQARGGLPPGPSNPRALAAWSLAFIAGARLLFMSRKGGSLNSLALQGWFTALRCRPLSRLELVTAWSSRELAPLLRDR